FWVGNAAQASFYFRKAWGFSEAAYAGLETGLQDRTSRLLVQGECRFLLTGALGPESPIAAHVRAHGDGVKDIALRVPDAEEAWRYAIAHGAQGVMEPTVFEDEHGKVVQAAIATYGETIHSLIQRTDYAGVFLPGFRQVDEYLEFYRGPGVQHMALRTDDILKTVGELRARGVHFLRVPDAYYDEVRERFADMEEVDVDALRAEAILADRDEEGYLLQIF